MLICGLSGGVDSSVMALLLHRALGDALTCIFVDNGVLRKGEAGQVLDRFRERYHLNVRYADAGEMFLVPPGRRRRPGTQAEDHRRDLHRGVRAEAAGLRRRRFLAQGTIYPDRIESASVRGPRRRSRRITTWAACRSG